MTSRFINSSQTRPPVCNERRVDAVLSGMIPATRPPGSHCPLSRVAPPSKHSAPSGEGAFSGSSKQNVQLCGSSKQNVQLCGSSKQNVQLCGSSKQNVQLCGSSKHNVQLCTAVRLMHMQVRYPVSYESGVVISRYGTKLHFVAYYIHGQIANWK